MENKNTNSNLEKILNNYYLDIIKNHYFDFKGSVDVKTFRYFLIINIIISTLLSLVSLFAFIYSLFIFIPTLALIVRRLKDSNLNPLFALIFIIPVVNLFFVIALCFIEKHHHNLHRK